MRPKQPQPGARRPAASSAAAGLLLIGLLLAVYLPGLSALPAVDRDEARFAQASRQMFESLALPAGLRDDAPIGRDASGRLTGGLHAGGWAVPMLGEKPRLNKPPMVYWLQAASAAALTGGEPAQDRIWHYRVPSVLAAIGACVIVWRLGVGMGRAGVGWLAAALLGVCPMVVWDANQARADQVLLAATTAAMAALWAIRGRAVEGRPAGWGVPLAFWLAVGAGILTKGPVTPMVAVLTAAGVSAVARDWRWLSRTRPLLGLAVLAAVLGPWVMAAAGVVGWGTLSSVWLDETLGRSAVAREGHWGPPGYHLVLLAVLFWPGSLVTLHALRAAARRAVVLPEAATRRARWRGRRVGDEAAVFLLAWLVPSWLVFEAIGTKLPHYTLPLYPAVALLTAWAACDLAGRAGDRPKIPPTPGVVLWAAIGLVLTVGLPVGAAAAWGGRREMVAAVIGGAAAAVLIAWGVLSVRRSLLRTHAAGIAAAVVFAAVFLQRVLPGAEAVWITRALTPHLGDGPVAAAGFTEDSLRFAARGRLESIPPEQAAAWAGSNPDGVLVLPAGVTGPAGWTRVAAVGGLNYSNGRRVELKVWRAGGE